MGKVRVLLADLKSYYPSQPYQLGLLVASARLEAEVRDNIEFLFTEHPREQPATEIAKAMIDADVDLVGASNYAWNYRKICEILEIFEKTDAKIPRILLGGPNSSGTFGDKMLVRYPLISAMVEGEGELPFRYICSSLVDSPTKDPFAGAPNCVLRREDGSVSRPEKLERIEFLDDIPSPYLEGILSTAPSPVFYETNRGCPYRCSFCYWGNGNAKIYRMSNERIREEMEHFARTGVSSFWIADANFGIFESDAEIAEMMGEINAAHGYPFKHVGVNWAKNSSDRVLDIAKIFRRGRMGCTTTLAIQSVTPEAEDKAKRYSMAPSKFTGLIAAAHEQDIDTYTDIIWGLPGESVDEYLSGLDSVINTGVPAILIHQLYLLPGTDFFDEREALGITMLSEVGGVEQAAGVRSDYSEYIVVSHPKMNRDDMRRGTRLMGVNHLLHNHDLGRITDFFLSRYGVTHRHVYEFFDEMLLETVDGFETGRFPFLDDVRELILRFANTVGLDEFTFYRQLSDFVWFKETETARGFRSPDVLEFMQHFYRVFCRTNGICTEPWEQALLEEMVSYNVLVSPKPAWEPEPEYRFTYDVQGIWHDILDTVHDARSRLLPVVGNGPGSTAGAKDEATWADLPIAVRRRLTHLLTDEYLEGKQTGAAYSVDNPWHFPPNKNTAEWLLSNRSKHCIARAVDVGAVAASV